LLAPSSNTQSEGPPFVGCPRLIIQYIPSYSPHLEAVSSNSIPMTRHSVVTGIQTTWGRQKTWDTEFVLHSLWH